MTMIKLNRRRMLQGSTALGAGGALLGGTSLLDWSRAWAEEMPFKPEKGASLHALRWNRFVVSEDIQFDKNIAAFTKATGIAVRLDKEFMDDIQPKAAVAANVGAGPDFIWGPNTTPQLFPDKLLDVTDVADYLGKKYGGWYPIAKEYCTHEDRWIAIPLCWGGNYINYRQGWAKDAGFDNFPDNTDDFLKLSKELKKMGHPGGFALGHASGDGNTWVHWLVWAFGGKLLSEDNKVVINSPETKMALEYARELYPSFVEGTASWNDSSNNKAFLAGDISYTDNGISIYAAANAQGMTEIAQDMNHAYWPVGPVGKPTEMQVGFPCFSFDYTKYPNACKAFMAFLMEAPQYNAWLEQSVGYFTQTLHGYDDNPVWKEDPKRKVYAEATARARSIAYAGTLGYAAAAVLADFVILDMVAAAATGAQSPADAMADAEKRANRYYRV
jgi:multiple sugar transport system substrate-binding protein